MLELHETHRQNNNGDDLWDSKPEWNGNFWNYWKHKPHLHQNKLESPENENFKPSHKENDSWFQWNKYNYELLPPKPEVLENEIEEDYERDEYPKWSEDYESELHEPEPNGHDRPDDQGDDWNHENKPLHSEPE